MIERKLTKRKPAQHVAAFHVASPNCGEHNARLSLCYCVVRRSHQARVAHPTRRLISFKQYQILFKSV